jgi:hypothetical protein
MAFDLQKYLDHSCRVSTADFDLSRATDFVLSAEEVRCLEYMMDVESGTIIYLRSVLHTSLIDDPDVSGFLSCWAYEEYFHGRLIRQFMEASGIPICQDRFAEVKRKAKWREWMEEIGTAILGRITPHFAAAYLTWGAVQELTTLEGYGLLASRTPNPLLKQILNRIIKDERRHFSFYYNKAQARLSSRRAQWLTTQLLQRYWTPVGSGLKDDPEVTWMLRFLFGNETGQTVLQRIDATIGRLPGLHWFNLLFQTACQAQS